MRRVNHQRQRRDSPDTHEGSYIDPQRKRQSLERRMSW
jgi:hypothetical protein